MADDSLTIARRGVRGSFNEIGADIDAGATHRRASSPTSPRSCLPGGVSRTPCTAGPPRSTTSGTRAGRAGRSCDVELERMEPVGVGRARGRTADGHEPGDGSQRRVEDRVRLPCARRSCQAPREPPLRGERAAGSSAPNRLGRCSPSRSAGGAYPRRGSTSSATRGRPAAGSRRCSTRRSRTAPTWSSCATRSLGDDELIEAARAFRAAADANGALFLLNDRPDLVARCEADGVHVGQDDTAPSDARTAAPARRPARPLDPLARADRGGAGARRRGARLHQRGADLGDADEGGPAGGRPGADRHRGADRAPAVVRDRRDRPRQRRRGRRRRRAAGRRRARDPRRREPRRPRRARCATPSRRASRWGASRGKQGAKAAERRKRKRRSAERPADEPRRPAPTRPANGNGHSPEDLASRAEARNQAAREALEPLAEGERPTVVTIGAIISGADLRLDPRRLGRRRRGRGRAAARAPGDSARRS